MQLELKSAMRRLGAAVLQCRRENRVGGRWQGTQYKADADLIAHDLLRRELERIADIPIISEEDVASQVDLRPRQYWLIDPIDGSASFAQGFPGFACQAALMTDGQPSIACVYAPALDRLYIAERGKGATVNDQRANVKKLDLRHLSLIDNYPQPRGVAKRLFEDLGCLHYLESGSIGLKICLIADGTADVFVKDVPVRDWDVAAPQLILSEAHGVLTQIAGQAFQFQGAYEKDGLVAASSVELLNEITEIAARYRRGE